MLMINQIMFQLQIKYYIIHYCSRIYFIMFWDFKSQKTKIFSHHYLYLALHNAKSYQISNNKYLVRRINDF